MRSRLLAGAANVAHLAGLSRRPAARAPSPPPAAAVASAPAATEPPAGEDPARAPVIAGAAEQPQAETDPEDPEADPDDEEDGEEDEEMMQARARERRRCQAILTSPHAPRGVAFAAYLAFETDTPRKTALAMLERLPNGAGLDARMGGVPRPKVGNGARPEQSDRHAVAASWDRAFAKARGGSQAPAAAGWDRAIADARR
jgi:hypothetical protein